MASQPQHEIAHDLSVFPPSLRGKRILLCTESFGPVNGVSRTTLMLVNHLRQHGARVAVVAPHNSTKVNTFVPVVTGTGAASSSHDGKDEVRVRGFPVPFNPELSIVYPLRLSTLYRKTFGSAPPDLVYIASPASLGFQVLLQLQCQRNPPPIICNFQTDLGAYCGILLPPPLNRFATWTFAQVEGFLFRHPSVQTVFYPSRSVRRYLERRPTAVPASKLRLLQRGVDAELFHPSRRSDALRKEIAPGGEIVLVCVSRVAGEKGFDFLAAAARELDRRGLAFALHIVGGNRSREVEAQVRALFGADLVRRGRVAFAGFRAGEALARAYAAGDVFVHCSVTETFGLVVLEAMASGVPVVARDEGGPSDVVREGETGFLVPAGDLAGFADRVMLLAEDGEMRRRMGRAAREQACGATWEKINNRVAWAMAERIEEREGGAGRGQESRSRSGVRVRVRERVRTLGGLGVIVFFWALIAVYLVVIKAGMVVRSRLRL